MEQDAIVRSFFMQNMIALDLYGGSSLDFGLFNPTGASAYAYSSGGWPIGSWQTLGIRLNQSSSGTGFSVWNHTQRYYDSISTTLIYGIFYNRAFNSCGVGTQTFSLAYGDTDIRAFLVYDLAMTETEFEQILQYVDSLPVDPPPLLSPLISTAKVR